MTVIGEIAPPDYKDVVKGLRNLAEDIEAGLYGPVETLVVALSGNTYETFGMGARSDIAACAYLFASSAQRLHGAAWA